MKSGPHIAALFVPKARMYVLSRFLIVCKENVSFGGIRCQTYIYPHPYRNGIWGMGLMEQKNRG